VRSVPLRRGLARLHHAALTARAASVRPAPYARSRAAHRSKLHTPPDVARARVALRAAAHTRPRERRPDPRQHPTGTAARRAARSLDLAEEFAADRRGQISTWHVNGRAEPIEVLFYAATWNNPGRGGVDDGSGARWTDATSARDALVRYLTGRML
jgi:hypothetical protein